MVIWCYIVALVLTAATYFLWHSYVIRDFNGHISLGSVWSVLTSSVAVAVILYKLFNKFFWRIPLVKKLLAIEIPYVGGEWVGEMWSSYTESSQPIEMEFIQTYTGIRIEEKSAHQRSVSITAEILTEHEGKVRIVYLYKTTPTERRPDYAPHEGAVILNVHDNGKLITGEYFNDPMQYQDRKATWGEYINVHRKEK